jgi:uncharacterized membrane protein YgaE (UPF0421/DUF939 family)
VVIAHVIAAVQPVHTTGINLESVATIVGCVIVVMTFVLSIMERRNRAIRDDIKNSVDHLSEILLAKLETKDNVAKLQADIAGLKENVRDLNRERA